MMWCPTGSSWVAGPDANRGRITEAGGERVDRGAFQKKASSAATRQSADHADKGAGGVAVSTSASGAGVRNAPGAVDGKMHGQGRQVPAARTGAGAGQARDGSEPNTNCVPTASTAGTFEGLPLTRGGTELFTYAPASIVVAGGQLVEMWPPVHLIDKNHVFEISPKLPAGLTLDRRIGLIHGKPEEATFGTQSYVVTLSSPDESTPWVKIAMLRLKVMDVFVPGHVATSFVENDAGETTITFREVIGRSQPEAICSPEVSLRQASPMQLIEDLCQQLEMQAQQRKPQPPVAPMLQSQGQAWQRPLPQQRPQGLPPHRDPQAPPRQLGQSGVPSRTAACNKDIDDMMATLVSMAFDSMPESQTQREQQLQQQSQSQLPDQLPQNQQQQRQKAAAQQQEWLPKPESTSQQAPQKQTPSQAPTAREPQAPGQEREQTTALQQQPAPQQPPRHQPPAKEQVPPNLTRHTQSQRGEHVPDGTWWPPFQ